jgi:hypothetical protein
MLPLMKTPEGRMERMDEGHEYKINSWEVVKLVTCRWSTTYKGLVYNFLTFWWCIY